MLKLTIPAREWFDEKTMEFISVKEQTITLEHSLISVSKWEAKWKKPFLSEANKTLEETVDYVRCMTITQNVNPLVYRSLGDREIEKVEKYIEDPMTATTVPNRSASNRVAGVRKETVTSELIYYWMVAMNIPSEYEKWHLNRLLMLINVIDFKNSKPEKKSAAQMAQERRALNEARRAKHHSRG